MTEQDIKNILRERILVLDGGLGTMIQQYRLKEEDYRGARFADWKQPLAGCNDLLVLTAPDVISGIHEKYLDAGADIISTDSFNSTSVSLADYGLTEYAYEINRAAASLARAASDKFTANDISKPRFVAGSMGPTNRTASMSADVNDPGSRALTFDDLVAAYTTQIKGLLDGGADILLIETIFDTLNAKAAVFAAGSEFALRGRRWPIMLSGTLADASGRTLSGQVVEAFYTSLTHAAPLSVGFNCAYGARQMLPYLERLSGICDFAVSAHPNAGLPNVMGGYDETPAMMAQDIEEYMRRGLINIIGGCCGTTPEHTRQMSRLAAKYSPRPVPEQRHETVLSGLEPLRITPDKNFINVGERTNVAGSAKFARLVREGNWDDAVSIARQQVEAGAQVVDVCMDDGLIDGPVAMTRFLNLAMAEPEIARVPMMIDSSSWEVIEAGLKCVQGKSVVNSISLKEGQEEFLRRARLVRQYGAAVVVMLFDETGQADIYERKIQVARRAYDLLTGDGFPAEDIIFDPNVLAVATGIREHNNYGMDFIRACVWIQENLPFAKVSGGVSNLSFAFRGNNQIREAMHSVFLYYAIAAGMDMGIVNPGMLRVYSDIESPLLELVEDVILYRTPDAAERLTEYAEGIKGLGPNREESSTVDRNSIPITERIRQAMLRGSTDHIREDILEAYSAAGTPLGVIDGYLMPAMAEIGELFGQGKMFLPQVVKSARVMKTAVSVLAPYMDADNAVSGKTNGKILIATVKGDVHDIGKNIVSVVMSCNGYQVRDLGVMVDSATIADETLRWGADIVGLSGLISPSLDEMIKVVRELGDRGMKIPVIIGGATTSDLHTAVKIAPEYSGPVIHSRDASENIVILGKLFSTEKEIFINKIRDKQETLRDAYLHNHSGKKRISLPAARSNRRVKKADEIIVPAAIGKVVFHDYSISVVRRYIDWNFFFPAWELKGHYPEILSQPEKGDEARQLMQDAESMLDRFENESIIRLEGAVTILPAVSEGDDIIVTAENGDKIRLPQLRSQESGREENLSIADYVYSGTEKTDYVGFFALTAGTGLKEFIEKLRNDGDDYGAIMAKLVADRLAEAFAEAVHEFVRRTIWGYETETPKETEQLLSGNYQGIRVAIGYPAAPDHSLKKEIIGILSRDGDIPVSVTENFMLDPGESVCGIIFAGENDKYFGVGKIDRRQLGDYARRRGFEPDYMASLIPNHLD